MVLAGAATGVQIPEGALTAHCATDTRAVLGEFSQPLPDAALYSVLNEATLNMPAVRLTFL